MKLFLLFLAALLLGPELDDIGDGEL